MIEIETAGAVRSLWGEGPVWWQDRLYYVDIEGHLVRSFHPASGEEAWWPVGQRVGTIAPRASGGLVAAGDHGFFFLDPETGTTTPIVDPEPNRPDHRFNDGKCAPDGNFFAGTISLKKDTGSASLYRLTPSLECSVAFSPVTNSNGIVWSADACTVYYIDTPLRKVRAFDYLDGRLENPRFVIDTGFIDASPDGMAIDTEGHLWIAFCHGACVICFDPADGKVIQRIELPCLEVTACAFGGEDLTDLYITTGLHSSLEEPGAGRLYRIRGHGARGLPANSFPG